MGRYEVQVLDSHMNPSYPDGQCSALYGQFPPMVSYMVGVGEQAGNLEEMLERVAETYDEEVEIATTKLTSMLEPLIIVALAVIVAGLAFLDARVTLDRPLSEDSAARWLSSTD